MLRPIKSTNQGAIQDAKIAANFGAEKMSARGNNIILHFEAMLPSLVCESQAQVQYQSGRLSKY